MSRCLPIAAVQAEPIPVDRALDVFAASAEGVAADFPQAELLIYPELYLCGLNGRAEERDAHMAEVAEPMDGPRIRRLRQIAGDLGRWLLPGSVYERSAEGDLYNTAVLLSPEGKVAGSYRKIFPWRPYEVCRPGDRFVTVDIPERGRIGLSICYDTWFPEVARQLAWMGAEVILVPTLTPTSDRPQELVLTQANAIANQVYVVSVNGAAPYGTGRSLIVDPEGLVRHQAGEGATVISDVLDLDAVSRVRRFGTAGLNRLWQQFGDGDQAVELPLYHGRIDPCGWSPNRFDDRLGNADQTGLTLRKQDEAQRR
jgi:predicted amidohydrolase